MKKEDDSPAIESAEDGIDFALRILDALDDGYEDREPVNSGELALMIEQRDAAVAAQARKQALEEALEACSGWSTGTHARVAIERLLSAATDEEKCDG